LRAPVARCAYPCAVPKKDNDTICVICKKPILLGEGRYRSDKGDTHTECYRRTEKKADTVDPRVAEGEMI